MNLQLRDRRLGGASAPLPPQLSRCWATAGKALQGASVRYGPLLANRWNRPRLEEALPEANG
jgi:hypothetical protein